KRAVVTNETQEKDRNEETSVGAGIFWMASMLCGSGRRQFLSRMKPRYLVECMKKMHFSLQGCDSSKVFPSGNQHLQRCCLLTRKEGLEKVGPNKCHTSPYLTDFRLRRYGCPLRAFKCGANTRKTFQKKAVRDRPQAVVPWALRSRSQVSKTNTNLPSFSGSSRNTLPRCGQPGSDNRSHTRRSTRVQISQNQILSTPHNISLISNDIPSSHCTANAHDASSPKVIPGLLKPRSRLHVGAFNVRTLSQIGQKASLARTLKSRSIDACCVSETRIQDPSKIINLISPYQNKEAARITLRVSGSPDAASRSLAGIGIALSRRAELALLDWIPVDSRLCAVRLNGTVRTRKDRNTRRCLFVVSAYAPTDCSSDEVKDEFYSKLSDLLQKARRSDIIIMAGDFNAQVGRLSENERHLGGCYGVAAQRTDNGDRLLQLCSDNRLFLANTNFRHKEKHLLTWQPPKS
ncbi:Craniofacial development protein, partial [Schistosoma japonicum]